VACTPCGNSAGALPMHKRTRRWLGIHAAAAGACLERLDPSITVASGSAAGMHAHKGSTAGGQGEVWGSVLWQEGRASSSRRWCLGASEICADLLVRTGAGELEERGWV
jgi:hypothetical protein